MIESNGPEGNLERLIHRLLRDQPLLSAPRSLEARVLSEIGRRIAQPWSRLNFMHWPLAGRVAFLTLCLAVAKLTLLGTAWTVSHLYSAIRFIPADWVAGALIVAAAMYIALFALGAFAYRTLSIER